MGTMDLPQVEPGAGGMVTVNVLLQLPDCASSWKGEATGSGILNAPGIPRDPPGMQWIRAGHPSEGTASAATMALQGLLQSELLPGVAGALVFRDRGVAVPVVNFDLTLALEVLVKHVAVSMVPPPCAKLPVPRAVEHMEELWVLHPYHGEEILVPEVALEVVLLCQLLYHGGLQQLVVELGLPHGFKVQEKDATVEAGQPVRRGVPHFGLGVLAAILPERVPAKRGKTGTGE